MVRVVVAATADVVISDAGTSNEILIANIKLLLLIFIFTQSQ
jgi:hypothetical protein